MNKVVSVKEMRNIEKQADAAGLSYSLMMEKAGLGLSRVIQEKYSGSGGKKVIGLVGSGNNGGDTLVALSDLQKNGWKAYVVLFKSRPIKDPLLARVIEEEGEVMDLGEHPPLEKLDAWVSWSDVLLDGVLGTGTHLPLEIDLAKYLSHISSLTPLPLVVAVDCPSGVDCDSGEAAMEGLRADVTVTMGAVKQGMLKFPAFEKLGDLQVVDIGISEDFPPIKTIKRFVVDSKLVKNVLPKRKMDSHKGTYGTGLIVAGSINYPGAALLAAKSAYRIGTGLVQLCVPGFIQGALAGSIPEVTWIVLPHEMGVISENAADIVLANLDRATALLVGPGLGKEEPTRDFLRNLISRDKLVKKKGGIGFLTGKEAIHEEKVTLPSLILDADGLNLLSQISGWSEILPPRSILTPHPGEMSRLTGLDVKSIQMNRLELVEKYAREWNQIVVLKGAVTIIADPDGNCAFIPIATSALAKGGTGDVLAGIIMGLCAQGVDSFIAAWAGSWIHAQAGLSATLIVGHPASILAGDVCEQIPQVLHQVSQ